MSEPGRDGMLVLVTIRVVLADEHLILRQGMRALLRDEADIELVGEADNGRDAVDVVLETGPDVALINLVLPSIDGVAATRNIHRERSKTRILILLSSDHVDTTAVIAAVRAGAIGVIHNSASIEFVAQSIRGAARGEAQFSRPTPACWSRKCRSRSV